MAINFTQRTRLDSLPSSPLQPVTFPAGEAHIASNGGALGDEQVAYVQGCDSHELMQLAMWADAVRRSGGRSVLMMPYLPGARQDRGRPFGAKVYADFINSMKCSQVICVDPHSPVMPSMLDNITIISSHHLIKQHVDTTDLAGVICPDEGAKARTERVARSLSLPVYYATKKRDFDTGKLSGFECEELPAEGKLLVVDDICDGGGTFMGLADATGLPKSRLELWITHGVFSGAAANLNDRYGKVYTTDSHPGALSGKVEAEIIPLLGTLIENISNKGA